MAIRFAAAAVKIHLPVRLTAVPPPQKRVVTVFADRVKPPPLARLIAKGHQYVRQMSTTATRVLPGPAIGRFVRAAATIQAVAVVPIPVLLPLTRVATMFAAAVKHTPVVLLIVAAVEVSAHQP